MAITVQGNSRPKRNSKFVWRRLEDEVVILDESGTSMTELNDTAAVIWGLADGSHSVAEIAREIERQFAVDSRQSQADTADFCQQLIEAGLLELEPDSDESG